MNPLPILGALTTGYTTKEIINFIASAFPGFAGKISKAISSGYSPEEVIKFLTNLRREDFTKVNRKANKSSSFQLPDDDGKPRSSLQKAYDLWYGNQEDFIPEQQSSILPTLGKAALGATAVGAGLYLNRGNPVIQSAFKRALPSSLVGAQNEQEQLPQAQMATAPVAQQTQPEVKTIDAKSLLDKVQSTQKVEELLRSGNGPQEVGGFFRKFQPNIVKDIEKEAGKPFEEVINEYSAQMKSISENKPAVENLQEHPELVEKGSGIAAAFKTIEGGAATNQLYEGIFDSLQKGKDTFAGVKDPLIAKAKPLFEKGLIKSAEDLKRFANGELKESEKIAKASVVASPIGLGLVKELRNGQALVEINGKLNQIPVDDLDLEPEEIKRAEIIIKPEEIPENLRSAALGFVSVPKSRRDIDIMYGPSGKFYRYYRKDGKPVSDDVIEKLREGQAMPISSGDTYMGAFDANIADSRGTIAYHDLKAKAQSKEAVEHGVTKKGKHVKEEDNPSKEFWYEELESPFIHGFINEFLKALAKRSSEYQKAKKAKK